MNHHIIMRSSTVSVVATVGCACLLVGCATASHTPQARHPAPTNPTNSPIKPLLIQQPDYPLAARLQCESGAVQLQFSVDEHGRPGDTKVTGGRNAAVFAASAKQALKDSRFQPKYVNGRPVAAQARFTYRFDPGESSDSSTAILIVPVTPDYPTNEQLMGVTGEVKLSFTIDKDGRPSNPTVISSKPRGVFDAVSLQALLRSRFAPKCVNGKPVPMRSTWTYHYELPSNG